MKRWSFAVPFAAGLIVGCMAGGPPLTAEQPPPAPVPGGAPGLGAPLLLDRADLRFGTTVHFGRIPDLRELADVEHVYAISQVVLSLPEWPASYAQIQSLERIPYGIGLTVLLPGYPPSREATEAWNLLSSRPRLILVVNGPPPAVGVISDLNSMRGLERVIAQMDHPSRAGLERLQRPLSFRKVMR